MYRYTSTFDFLARKIEVAVRAPVAYHCDDTLSVRTKLNSHGNGEVSSIHLLVHTLGRVELLEVDTHLGLLLQRVLRGVRRARRRAMDVNAGAKVRGEPGVNRAPRGGCVEAEGRKGAQTARRLSLLTKVMP